MAVTSLAPGDAAIIGYNSGMPAGAGNPATEDKLSIVLLRPVTKDTAIFITDRAWVPTAGSSAANAGSFATASGDGTVAWTAPQDLPAGTVVSFTQAQLAAAGIDISPDGDAFYVYQGSNANTPTQFLFAAEFADGNTTFNGSLVNTGLVAGQTAVAVGTDSGAYAGPTTSAESFFFHGAGTTLLKSITDPTHWVGDDADGVNAIEQEVQTGPWLQANDVDLWGVFAGIGGLAHTRGDSSLSGGTDDFNHVRLYQGANSFTNLRDLVFDTADGKFFLVDSNISGANRILQGNIADLYANPGQAPVLTELYRVNGASSADLSARLDNLVVDAATDTVYFTQGDKLQRIGYDAANQSATTLFSANVAANPAGASNNFFNDMAMDFAGGKVFLSSTRVGTSAGGDIVSKNYIYELSGVGMGAAANSITFAAGGGARLLPFGAEGQYFFPRDGGTLDGLAYDAQTSTLYFSTGEILYDSDGVAFTPPVYGGGMVGSYVVDATNTAGTYTVLFRQPAQTTGPVPGLMGDLEIDTVAGKWYVIDTAGAGGNNQDQQVWMGNLNGTGTPVQFTTTIGDVNGSTLAGFTLNHAPTLAGIALSPGVTEASSGAASGETARVSLFAPGALTMSDADTTRGPEIGGAVVRIAQNFQSGATHQDYLLITGAASGKINGITFSYDASTGAMVLRGPGTAADYRSVLSLVTFSTSGDDPTAAGTAGTRQIALSVTDGLSFSREILGTVTVTGINDAPVVSPGAAMNFIEDSTGTRVGTPVNAVTGISIADVDANPTAGTFSVNLTVNFGSLDLRTDVAGGLSGAQVSGNGTGTLVLTGSLAQINATLAAVNGSAQANGLVYTPPAHFNGQAALVITANDGGASGTDPGTSGNPASEAGSATKILAVQAVNDAPVATVTSVAAATTYEDQPSAAGQTVSALFGGTFSDPLDQQRDAATNPAGSLADTLGGVAVIANGSSGAQGTWQYLSSGGTWTDIGAVSAGAAKLFAATTSFRFVPAQDYSGTAPTLQVRLVDASGPAFTDGAVVNLSGAGATGGTTRYSQDGVTLTQDVVAVNDAPRLTGLAGDATTFAEDGPGVAIDVGGNAVFSDVDSANFAGGTLRVGVTGNAVAAEDVLRVQEGGAVFLQDNFVVVDGMSIGTVAGGVGGADLVITFNEFATAAAASTLLHAIQYANSNTANPSTASRTITVTLTDGDGNANGGADSVVAVSTVAVTATNDAPSLTTSAGAASFRESFGSTPSAVAVDGGIVVTDVDSSTLASATVAVTGNFAAGDMLTFINSSTTIFGNITASYNAGTGVLTLASFGATASMAQWQAALRAVTFDNTSQDPSAAARTVTFAVSDGTHAAVPVSRTVTVTPLNDPPTLTATGADATYTEGGAAVSLFSAVTASTVEAGQVFTEMRVTVGNLTDGAAEILRIDGTDIALTDGRVLVTTSGLSIEVMLHGGTADVIVTGGSLDAAGIQALIGGIQYRNDSQAPTDAVRTVAITGIADSGSNAGLNSNVTILSIQATVDVNPVNTAAVITGTSTGTVTEAGGVANGTSGTPTASGDLNATDVDNPADTWTAVAAATASTSGFGSYTVTAAGVWTYVLDNGNTTVQGLAAGATLTDTFTVRTVDGTPQVVTITIAGSNDAATITGTATGSVTEAGGVANASAGTPTASGDLNAADVDNTADAWTALGMGVASTSNNYGSFAVTAAGVWTYALNDSHPEVQALNVGQTLTDTFTVQTVDGTQQVVTVTIHGSNDAPTITGAKTGSVLEAAGVDNASTGTPTATGNLNAVDVDNPADTWAAIPAGAASTGGYGTYGVTSAGVWTYTLDNANTIVQALQAGQTLDDTFTVNTADGTPQVVTITITGRNDAATVTGAREGEVFATGDAAAAGTATGDLDAADVDNVADSWLPVAAGSASESGYGTFSLTAAGVWTYVLDEDNADVRALAGGGTLSDTFVVRTVDGTVQLVRVTIEGHNDAAVITGTTTGAVVEAGGVANGTTGTPTATGDLDATDIDGNDDAWTVVAAGTASTGGFGTYAVTGAGAWTYALDNANATVQALKPGDTLVDTFTVRTADGTPQVVTITIAGSNDAATITGTATGSVTEAGGVANGTGGSPTATGDLNAADVDNTADAWTVVAAGTATSSGYGTYALTAAGAWTYTLDNGNAMVQALAADATLADTFTVQTVDGTPKVVTVTIHGSNDAATITGTTTGGVTEAGGVANGSPGTATATGDLDAADVDNTADAWTAVAAGTASTGGYGTYALTAAGVWTYALDNGNTAVQALQAGQALVDTFTVRTVDGTPQVVTITIAGSNDAATITGTASGSVVEAGGVANATAGTPIATGDLNATDPDNVADAWTAVAAGTASTGGYGTYALTAAGVWTYTLDDGNAMVQALAAGATLADTFTVQTVDGTQKVVTVTIHGSNDAATITGATTGGLIEAGGVDNGLFAGATAFGDLDAADVDNAADAWTAVSAPTASTGGYGVYTLTAAGAWTYALDNGNSAVQALQFGQELVDTFTVRTVDGTQQVVSITISGWNDAPTVTASSGAVTFTEPDNATPVAVAVDAGIVLSDVDNATLSSARVELTGSHPDDGELLQFTNAGTAAMGNITGSFADGVLTLTSAGGTATLAQWQAALRAVTYLNPSDDPGEGSRTIRFTVNDGSADSTVATRVVDVVATNDTPVLTAGTGTADFTEGNNTASLPVAVAPALVVADADDASLARARVYFTAGHQAGEDLLSFVNTDAATFGGITGSYEATTGVLTLAADGGATLAQWQAALRAVRYVNTSQDPDEGTRTIAFVVNDGTVESAPVTRDVSVTAANDDVTGVVTITGTAEQGQTLVASHTLGDLDGLGTIAWQWYADGDAIAGATGGSLTLTQEQVGAAITAVASYTDGAGNAESRGSAATGAVANLNDPPTGGVAISGEAKQGETLTASHTLDDIDGLGTVTYQWLAGGQAIAGATGSTLLLTQAQVGQEITVKASYVDDQGTPEGVTSGGTPRVVNVNDRPTGSVTVVGTPAVGRTLTAANTLADLDGLGAVVYQWKQDGVAIAGATGASFDVTQAQVGKAITVTASYVDGFGAAESVSSDATGSVLAVNHAPTGGVLLIGPPQVGAHLTAVNSLADPDGMGAVSYEWLVDGVVVQGATGNRYTVQAGDLGKEISARATYTDGLGQPENASSPGLAIQPLAVDVTPAPGESSLTTDVARYDLPRAPGAATPLGEITLAADVLNGAPDPDPSTAYLTRFTQTAGPDLPRGLTNALGILSFEAQLDAAGNTETFSLLMDQGVLENGFWATDANGRWVNLASAAYGGTTVQADGQVRLDIRITDGGAFDLDGVANGVISASGLVGLTNLSFIGHAPDTGDDFVLF